MNGRVGRWPVRLLAFGVGAAIGYAAWTLRELSIDTGIGELPVGQPLAVAGLLVAVVLGAQGSDRIAAAAPSAGWLGGVAAAGVTPVAGWDRYGVGLLIAAVLATAALARLAPQAGQGPMASPAPQAPQEQQAPEAPVATGAREVGR